jgi:integrase
MTFEIIKEEILKARPNLSKSSVNTYYSILKNLYKKMGGDEKEYKKDLFKNKDLVDETLKDMKPSQRKTTLSALVIYVDDEKAKEHYREKMMDDIKTAKEETISQKRDESKDWIDWSDVIAIHNALRRDTYYILKENKLNSKERALLQDYVLLSLYVLIPPRRSMDYMELKFKPENGENYIDFKKNKLVFNKYKTSKFYKTQEVEMPRELKTILSKWEKYNESPYVLTDTNGNKLNQVKLNQRLNRIFDMKISVNALRHSYLTNKYGAIPALKDMLDTADEMGHDLSTALTYVKK